MAAPERIRNSRVVPLMELVWSKDPAANTMIQEKIRTTTVRTAVATVESVFRIPHLARIEVTPAKNAEPIANKSHIFTSISERLSLRSFL